MTMTPLVKLARPGAHPDSLYWQWIRKQALERDKYRCQTCSKIGTYLDVHHKCYDRFGREDLQDLITLCDRCHKAITEAVRARRRQA